MSQENLSFKRITRKHTPKKIQQLDLFEDYFNDKSFQICKTPNDKPYTYIYNQEKGEYKDMETNTELNHIFPVLKKKNSSGKFLDRSRNKNIICKKQKTPENIINTKRLY